MIEAFSASVPEDLVRQQWAVFHDTVRWLATAADGFTLAQLELVRRDLRRGGRWSPELVPAGFEHQAQLLLHDVAAALAEKRGGGYVEYYRGAGDLLLEAAPDDVAELDT